MDSPKNGSGTSPFKIFSMFRVNIEWYILAFFFSIEMK
jgi:hypothetical protein